MRVMIEVSPGELFDKISILKIKLSKVDKVNDCAKFRFISNEYEILTKSAEQLIAGRPLAISSECWKESGQSYINALDEVNIKIWDVLQYQRDLENIKDFGPKFVQASLDVYHLNDERAEYKRLINQLLFSDITEVKLYKDNQ